MFPPPLALPSHYPTSSLPPSLFPGTGLQKMSYFLSSFTQHALKKKLNVTRFRQMLHTAAHETVSPLELRQYEEADTHTSAVAENHYLKLVRRTTVITFTFLLTVPCFSEGG